jgi:hypothetical protein
LGKYFHDKPVKLGITYVKLTANIELLSKLVGIVPALKASTPEVREAKLRLFRNFEAYRENDPSVIVSELDLTCKLHCCLLSSPFCPSVQVHVCIRT